MAKADLSKLQTLLEKRLKDTSPTYRKEISDKLDHHIHISEQRIKTQVKKELIARGAGDKKGKLAKSLNTIIETEVPLMCQGLYNEFKNYKATKTEVTGIEGGPRRFSFVLANQGTNTTSVFATFRRIKAKHQKNLIDQIKAQIKVLNSGRTKSQIAAPTSNFLDIGHDAGSAVSEQRQQAVEDALFQFGTGLNSDSKKVLKSLLGDLKIKLVKNARDPIDTLSVSLESSRLNKAKGGGSEKDIILQLTRDLQTLLDRLGAETFYDQKGSDSKKERVKKTVLNPFGKAAAKNKKIRATFKAKKVKTGTTKTEGKKKKAKTTRAKPFKDTERVKLPMFDTKSSGSMFSLLAILNKRLPDVVKKNMRSPALESRSGRFAESVEIMNVISTKRGFPSFGYKYQKDPYQVFEQGEGSAPWASRERDPRRLIDTSIREVAANMALGRFYTRRL
tara:strand:+ start:2049 stop:3392 length:1344 start_codon:yes stop_codon:yes gene_type:complete